LRPAHGRCVLPTGHRRENPEILESRKWLCRRARVRLTEGHDSANKHSDNHTSPHSAAIV
jgi:hypothetical protein